MTEADWLSSADVLWMVAFLRWAAMSYKTRWQGWVSVRRFNISERKWQLFQVGCCRRVLHLVSINEANRVVEIAEQLAEGLADKNELEQAARTLHSAYEATPGDRLLHVDEAMNALGFLSRFDEEAQEYTRTYAASAQAIWILWREIPLRNFLSGSRPGPGVFSLVPVDVQKLQGEMTREYARQADLLRDVVGNPFDSPKFELSWLTWNNGLIPRLAEAIYQNRTFEDLPILADALEDAGCDNAMILQHCRSGKEHTRGCWVVDGLLHQT